jgi:hypothetical protein
VPEVLICLKVKIQMRPGERSSDNVYLTRAAGKDLVEKSTNG